MANDLRAQFEAQASDPSFKFARSRKGTYVNPALARDWKWFQAGAARLATEAAAMAATVPGDAPITCLADWAKAGPEQINRGNWGLVLAGLLKAREALEAAGHKETWLQGYINVARSGAAPVAGQPAEPSPAAPLSDAQIKAAVHSAVKADKLSWAGYEKDEAGEYTVPVLSPKHYQLARVIESTLAAPKGDSNG